MLAYQNIVDYNLIIYYYRIVKICCQIIINQKHKNVFLLFLTKYQLAISMYEASKNVRQTI